jgi:uncharacterized membrane protein YfcA
MRKVCGVECADVAGWDWALAVAAALCVGLAKTGFGGVGMAPIVLMALVMPARASTGALLTMLVVGDIFAVVTFRRHARWGFVLRLLPAALPGIVAGWVLMPGIPDGVFRPMIGWLLLGLLGLLLVLRAKPAVSLWVERHAGIGWLAGGIGGVTTMLANAAGPVMTIYLLACRLPKLEFVGTAAWFFLILNLTKLPFSASLGLITRDSLVLTLALAPCVVAGGFLGRWLLGKINQRVFEALLLAFIGVAAFRLIAIR